MEVVALSTNDTKLVVHFVKKNIFMLFKDPCSLVSDMGTHFCNKLLGNLLDMYEVKHKTTTTYHPQTSIQVEVSNREVRKILEKTIECK